MTSKRAVLLHAPTKDSFGSFENSNDTPDLSDQILLTRPTQTRARSSDALWGEQRALSAERDGVRRLVSLDLPVRGRVTVGDPELEASLMTSALFRYSHVYLLCFRFRPVHRRSAPQRAERPP